jgi:glycosyltransferase involved in cell wall biosynthesis
MSGLNIGPSVSVIIPTYNYARFLTEAAESVLGQTFSDLELIIVDDGSTDNTVDVVRPYLSDDRVHYIHQENRGLSAARNRGIRESRGEFIALLDADDVWFPSKIEKQVRLMGESPDVGLVYCKAENVSEKGDALPGVPVPHKENITYKDLMYFPLTNPSCVFIRKRIFDEVGLFDESFTHLEDSNMWIRILRYYRSAYVDEVLVKIRKHPKSISTDLAKMEEHLLRHVKKCIEMFPELEQDREEAFFQIYKGLMYLAYMYNKKKEILIYYIKAGWLRPSFIYESISVFFRKYFFRNRQFH